MRCACARGRPSDCQPRPHSQQQTLQLISQHLSKSAALLYLYTMTPEMHFNASRSLTQPLLDCILYPTQNFYDPGTLPSSAN